MEPSSPLSAVGSDLPSSPLSCRSSTPPLPSPYQENHLTRLLSPESMSANTSGMQSPIIKLGEPCSLSSSSSTRRDRSQSDDDESPPAKKRRIATPKERTTEHLDLMKPNAELSEEENQQLDRLMTALRKKKKIVVIAGAGISVSAGIPDFRSAGGLFASAKKQQNVKGSGKHLFDASVYKHNSSTQSFHNMVREMADMSKNAEPTPFHHLLASLAQEGRLLRLYSQNIDCIDTSMEPLATNVPLNNKHPWPATIQLHGGLQKMVCTKCNTLSEFDAVIFDGPEAPLCNDCKELDQARTIHAGKRSHGIGRLRPRFVLYNEFNPDAEAIGNVSSADLKARPDAIIVVGTTLKVPGTRRLVKELCQVTRGRRDGFTAWINPSPEPKGIDLKDCWDLVVRAKSDTVAALVNLPAWNLDIGSDYLVSGDDKHSDTRIQVDIRTSPVPPIITEDQDQAIPTPRPSPKLAAAKPGPKTKQSKLVLGQPFLADEKSTKTAKPRGRKPGRPAKKDTASKGSALPIFKSVKSTKQPLEIKAIRKAIVANGNLQSSVSLPNLHINIISTTDSVAVKRPRTPEIPNSDSTDTISPHSVPRGMHNIIDV